MVHPRQSKALMHLMGLITPALPQTHWSLTIDITTGSLFRFCSFFIMGCLLSGNGGRLFENSNMSSSINYLMEYQICAPSSRKWHNKSWLEILQITGILDHLIK